MNLLKGTIIGLALGIMTGAVIGASNCEMVHSIIKQGKKQIRRFTRKYSLM